MKGFWLKFDPMKDPERVQHLDWLGEVTGDIMEREPMILKHLKGRIWFIIAAVNESRYDYREGCTYYDEDGDPFDSENQANWDGDQQKGFRD
jgi:hypothetical protein